MHLWAVVVVGLFLAEGAHATAFGRLVQKLRGAQPVPCAAAVVALEPLYVVSDLPLALRVRTENAAEFVDAARIHIDAEAARWGRSEDETLVGGDPDFRNFVSTSLVLTPQGPPTSLPIQLVNRLTFHWKMYTQGNGGMRGFLLKSDEQLAVAGMFALQQSFPGFFPEFPLFKLGEISSTILTFHNGASHFMADLEEFGLRRLVELGTDEAWALVAMATASEIIVRPRTSEFVPHLAALFLIAPDNFPEVRRAGVEKALRWLRQILPPETHREFQRVHTGILTLERVLEMPLVLPARPLPALPAAEATPDPQTP